MTAAASMLVLRLEPQLRRALLGDEPLTLGARAYDLLQALAERRERVVSKNELMDIVWPDVVVEENNLQVQISSLRKALGPAAITTVPGRGYRFTAEVETATPTVTTAPAQPKPLADVAEALIGRADELAQLATLLREVRLITLAGPGGIGKTRLALAAAAAARDALADGMTVVDLAPLPTGANAEAIAAAVARALDLRFDVDRPSVQALASAMRYQSLLLVLDNCEHLLAGAAEVASTLLAAAPGLHVLATSQEPLNLAEEHVLRLPLLALPPSQDLENAQHYGAVALFVARAKAADRRFVFDASNREAVVEICARLDGLPLAIELAAARVPALGVAGLQARLDERLRLLTGGRRDAAARQQTLRASLEWSLGLLSDDERTVFCSLGVFAGGFTIELAQDVASNAAIDRWAVLDVLASLVDKSLVVADAADPPRYALLESARALAIELLQSSGQWPIKRAAHAVAMACLLQHVDQLFYTSNDYSPAQTRLLREIENLRAALAWCEECGDSLMAVRLLGPSCRLWNRCGLAGEASSRFAALAPLVDASVPAQDAALFWLGMVVVAPESPPAAVVAATTYAVKGFHALGDQPHEAYAWCWRAIVAGQRGNLAQARKDADAAAALEQADWPPLLRAMILLADCSVHTRAGDQARARAVREAALMLVRASGDHPNIQFNLRKLADADLAAGDFDALMRSSEALIADARAHGPAWAARLGEGYRSVALLAAGRLDEAASAASLALPAWRTAGWTGWLIDHLAWLAAARSQAPLAAQLLGCADAQHARVGRERRASEQRAVSAALRLIEPTLPSHELEHWRRAGRELDDDAVLVALQAFPAPRL
jgi:predicted ATPase/DNA-binding winged helix-turn-helix (wHTH) protein